MFQKHGKKKEFLLTAQDIRPLVESRMGCIATDRITVDGLRVARAIIGRYAPAEG